MWGGNLRYRAEGEYRKGKGLGEATWKVKSRKAKGRDELNDGKEAEMGPHWVGCGIRRTIEVQTMEKSGQ